MACFAGPSFQEANGSAACAAIVTKTTMQASAIVAGFGVRLVFTVVSFRILIGFSN
jgi:hypothetical protein